MKEVVGYVKWWVKNAEAWKLWFLFAISLNAISWAFPAPYNMIINCTGTGIVVLHMLKWFVWDAIVSSWNKYREHRNEIFSTIKTSDKG